MFIINSYTNLTKSNIAPKVGVNRCPISGCSLAARQEQKSYTYHSFLPDDAHAILNARNPMRDLCEIILAHGFLFNGERTVVGPHNIQSVTTAGTQ